MRNSKINKEILFHITNLLLHIKLGLCKDGARVFFVRKDGVKTEGKKDKTHKNKWTLMSPIFFVAYELNLSFKKRKNV